MDGSTSYWPGHPLDIDLADFVAGLLDPSESEQLEEHLAGCLLCRIKTGRLREAEGTRQDTAAAEATSTAVSPAMDPFAVPEAAFGEGTASEPAPGEVWSLGGDERVLSIVVGFQEGRVLVAPLTFDVEAIDDETIALGAPDTPFDEPVAVYPTLATEVPRGSLRVRLGALSEPGDISVFLAGSKPGTWRGTPITDATDPRLELRQTLADQLGALEEIAPDPDTAADAPPSTPAQIASALASELRERRGRLCSTRVLPVWVDLTVAHMLSWTPIVAIEELGVLLIVFDTPHGLIEDEDFNAANAVLTRLNASALVVLQTGHSPLADLYDAAALHEGIEVPSGHQRGPRPLIEALAAADAVMKFLERSTSLSAASRPQGASVQQVDVDAALSEAAVAALSDIDGQATRARITPKVNGYHALTSARADFERLLAEALRGRFTIDELLRIGEDQDR